MKLTPFFSRCQALALPLLAVCLMPAHSQAEWLRDDVGVSWKSGDNVLWHFSFDPAKGKPFFHPLTTGATPALTGFKPVDHPHHYALWFAWKYINKENYWEENVPVRGITRWKTPVIQTNPSGSATIRMELSYINAKGELEMSEDRLLVVSAPKADGSYNIDWTMNFTAGKSGVILDRTPMPGEPGGAVNGGYAGLSIRMAQKPLEMTMVSTNGPIDKWASNRSRPNAPAVAANYTDAGKDIGGISMFSDPANIGEQAPWYLINDPVMQFMCAAILAPKPITLAADGKLKLNYRVAIQPTAWTPETLQTAYSAWLKK